MFFFKRLTSLQVAVGKKALSPLLSLSSDILVRSTVVEG